MVVFVEVARLGSGVDLFFRRLVWYLREVGLVVQLMAWELVGVRSRISRLLGRLLVLVEAIQDCEVTAFGPGCSSPRFPGIFRIVSCCTARLYWETACVAGTLGILVAAMSPMARYRRIQDREECLHIQSFLSLKVVGHRDPKGIAVVSVE